MSTRATSRTPLTLVALASLGLAAAPALAQSQWGQQQQQQRFGQQQGQRQGQATYSGQVQSVREVSLRNAPRAHTIVEVQFQDGQSHLIDLGPQADLSSLDLRQGDSLTVRGNQRFLGGQPVIMAHNLSIEGQQYSLARAGQQMRQRGQQWRGQDQFGQGQFGQGQFGQGQFDQQGQVSLQGQIQNIREVNLRNAPPQHTIVQVTLQDGRTALVNLGRQIDLNQLDVQRGDQIFITGDRFQIGNQPILAASTLSIEGQQYDLGWFGQQPGRGMQAGQRFGQPMGRGQQQLQQIISNWPQASQQAARDMINSYGPPDEFTQSILLWYNNGPWARTLVRSDPAQHNFPMPHEDVLSQTI